MARTLNQSEDAEAGKVPVQVIAKIREAILDEIFKPGDRLTENELAERFKVSRSPIREALLALEKEGTVIIPPYKGAIVATLSAEEIVDITETRLALFSAAVKPAHRFLAPADYDKAYQYAEQATASRNAKEHFEFNRRFWNVILEKARRPILWQLFSQLDDRVARYYPVLSKLYPIPKERPKPRELFIESYRRGNIDEALRVFKTSYRDVIHRVVRHLDAEEGRSL